MFFTQNLTISIMKNLFHGSCCDQKLDQMNSITTFKKAIKSSCSPKLSEFDNDALPIFEDDVNEPCVGRFTVVGTSMV